MSLWCDKYRPETFGEFRWHGQQQTERLKKLVASDNFPHLFIHGPAGSGKRTAVRALLHELFGPGVRKLRIETKMLETPSGKKLVQRFVSSNYHLEMNPSENGFHDRVVVQEMIKTVATSGTLQKKPHFRVVVIDEADRLTRDAQQSLRRTLEMYVATCRVILIAERSSPIIPALRSRCLSVRNGAPTPAQIRNVLEHICHAETLQISGTIIEEIMEHCDRNLRRAILLLQAYANSKEHNPQQHHIDQFRWQQKIQELAKKLSESQSVRKVREVRAILYDLQTHLIPAELLLRTLVHRLMNYCLDDDMKAGLISMAAEVNHRICHGSKPIIHLELFCVKFIMMFRCTVEKVAFDLDQPMELD